MTSGIWILGDQLWAENPIFQSHHFSCKTPIILIESLQHIQLRPYHRQKLVLVWSAMDHFAAHLQEKEFSVTSIQAADHF